DGVEHRQAEVLAAALARRHAADDLGAVVDHLLGVEGALGAGEALDDDLGVLVDQNAHCVSFVLRSPGKAAGRTREMMVPMGGAPGCASLARATDPPLRQPWPPRPPSSRRR